MPEYYREPFHAYESGNLCWEAALEGEIASRDSCPFQPASRPSDLVPTWPSDGPTWRSNPLPGAVGARNFPEAGADGELAFRGAFDEALASLGAAVPAGGAVVDLGCGSGISTRRLAANWPAAASVLGLDLSPHFLAVGPRACTPYTRTCTCTCTRASPRACTHVQTTRMHMQPATCNVCKPPATSARAGGSAAGRARSCPGGGGRRGRRLAVGQRLARLHGRTGGAAPRRHRRDGPAERLGRRGEPLPRHPRAPARRDARGGRRGAAAAQAGRPAVGHGDGRRDPRYATHAASPGSGPRQQGLQA